MAAIPLSVLLTWLAVAGTSLLVIGFIAGEVAAAIHHAHHHRKG